MFKIVYSKFIVTELDKKTAHKFMSGFFKF
jgi:hypothetical protein